MSPVAPPFQDPLTRYFSQLPPEEEERGRGEIAPPPIGVSDPLTAYFQGLGPETPEQGLERAGELFRPPSVDPLEDYFRSLAPVEAPVPYPDASRLIDSPGLPIPPDLEVPEFEGDPIPRRDFAEPIPSTLEVAPFPPVEVPEPQTIRANIPELESEQMAFRAKPEEGDILSAIEGWLAPASPEVRGGISAVARNLGVDKVVGGVVSAFGQAGYQLADFLAAANRRIPNPQAQAEKAIKLAETTAGFAAFPGQQLTNAAIVAGLGPDGWKPYNEIIQRKLAGRPMRMEELREKYPTFAKAAMELMEFPAGPAMALSMVRGSLGKGGVFESQMRKIKDANVKEHRFRMKNDPEYRERVEAGQISEPPFIPEGVKPPVVEPVRAIDQIEARNKPFEAEADVVPTQRGVKAEKAPAPPKFTREQAIADLEAGIINSEAAKAYPKLRLEYIQKERGPGEQLIRGTEAVPAEKPAPKIDYELEIGKLETELMRKMKDPTAISRIQNAALGLTDAQYLAKLKELKAGAEKKSVPGQQALADARGAKAAVEKVAPKEKPRGTISAPTVDDMVKVFESKDVDGYLNILEEVGEKRAFNDLYDAASKRGRDAYYGAAGIVDVVRGRLRQHGFPESDAYNPTKLIKHVNTLREKLPAKEVGQAFTPDLAPKTPTKGKAGKGVRWNVAPKSVARTILDRVKEATAEEGPTLQLTKSFQKGEEFARTRSSKPQWVQDTGIPYAELRRTIDRVLDGKPITERQSAALTVAYDGAKRDFTQRGDVSLSAQRAARKQPVKPTESRVAGELKEGEQVKVGDEWLDVKKTAEGVLLEDGVKLELDYFDAIPGKVKTPVRTEKTPAGDQVTFAPQREVPTERIREVKGRAVKDVETQADVFRPDKIAPGNLPQDQAALFEKAAPPPKRGVVSKEILKPGVEELSGGLGALRPFKTAQQKYNEKLRAARKKRNQEGEAPVAENPASISGDIAAEPSIIIGRAPRDVGPSANIRTPSNLFGAIPGQPARYGKIAQQATRDLLQTELAISVEVGTRGRRIEMSINKVDKSDWGKIGERFYDHIVDPLRDAEMKPSSREAAVEIRGVMKEMQKEIVERKRSGLRRGVEKITNRQWREKNNLKGKKLTPEQRASFNREVDAELKRRVSDDWGIENYLPEMHVGNWEVFATIEGKPHRIAPARNPMEAIGRAMEHYGNHPELSPESYYVTGKAFIMPDILRTSRKRMWQTVKEIANAADKSVSRESVAAALRGKIGAKESRQKHASFLKQRKGGLGFSKDIVKVLSAYNQTFTRWHRLTDLNPRMEKHLSDIRAEGRPNVAANIQGTWEYLWGQSASKLSRQFDATMQKLPVFRDRVRPLALERWTGYVRGGVMMTFLKLSPRFHLLNRAQTYQTLWPEVTNAQWNAGHDFYRSPAGRIAREQFGIKYLTGGKLLEGGRSLTSPEFRERFRGLAPETFNQEVAWSTMYKKGIDMGMTPAKANDYALLKGNLHTQFLHLRTDTPPVLRGPITATIFQFKRFPIKYLEQGFDLIQSKDVPGVAKWLGVHLLMGGAKMGARTAQVAGLSYLTTEAYRRIKQSGTEQAKQAGMSDEWAEASGEWLADTFAFGVPGMIGLDMSYSIQAIDVPFGETLSQKIGNTFLGPSGSLIEGALRAAEDTKGTESSAITRAAKSVTQRVPALRWIQALQAFGNKLDSGEYPFQDPAGRQKFRTDLRGLIAKALGARTTREGEMDMLIEGALYIQGQRDEVLDALVADLIKEKPGLFLEERSTIRDVVLDDEDLRFRVLRWNDMWPEFEILGKSVEDRLKARAKSMQRDKLERILARLGKAFKTAEQFKR